MKQIFEIDGAQINEPNNYQLNSIELNYDKGRENARLSIDTWDLGVGDQANPNDGDLKCLQHKAGGLTGGVGVTEGKPFKIKLQNGTEIIELFDGYLDLWRARYECGKVTANAVQQGGVDWLESGVTEFSFEYLASIGLITEANYVLVPYIISTVPNYREAFMATITIYVISSQILEQIEAIVEMTSEAANPFEASAIARLVLRIIYIATLLAALIKLMIDVFNMIIQPVKYHAGMYVNDLLTIGAAHLGLTYSSSFLQSDPLDKMLYLPEKFFTKDTNTGLFKNVLGLLDKDKTGQKGYPPAGYTFGDLLGMIQLQFYAKIVIVGTELKIEKQNFTTAVPKFQIPAVERTNYTLNESDFYSNFIIKFATDLNDKNTIQEYKGTLYHVQIDQIVTSNKRMKMTKRLQTIYINCALGKRKTELTFPEEIFDAFFKVIGGIVDILVTVINAIIDVINEIIKILNKIIKALAVIGIDVGFKIPTINNLDAPNFGDMIEDRLDMLKMENDFIHVPKLILVGNNTDARNNKLLPGNETVLSAKYLWDNFHFPKSFVPQPGNEKGNQYYIYTVDKMPFTFDDFKNVRQDNEVIDTDGTRTGRIDSLKFLIDEQSSPCTFRINETYTKNLIEIKFEPNGV